MRPQSPLEELVTELSDEQRAEFKEAFDLFDLDGGGDIDSTELGTVMRSLGANPSEEQIKKMIDDVDEDGSGSIDFPEFCQLMARKMQISDCEEELHDAFHVFDEKDSGFIDVAALREIIAALAEHLGEDEIDEVVRMADDDGDGLVSYERFADLMMMHRRPAISRLRAQGRWNVSHKKLRAVHAVGQAAVSPT